LPRIFILPGKRSAGILESAGESKMKPKYTFSPESDKLMEKKKEMR